MNHNGGFCRAIKRLWDLAVVSALYLVYYLFKPTTHYFSDLRPQAVIIQMGAPILLGMALTKRLKHGKRELALLLAYVGWALGTRLLFADPVLSENLLLYHALLLMPLLFWAGAQMEQGTAARLTAGIAWLTVAFYTVISILLVYTACTRTVLTNRYGYWLGYVDPWQWRAYTLSFHPNIMGEQLILAFCLCMYLFFSSKNWAKGICVIAAVLMAAAVALTASRAAQTFLSLSFALTVGLWAVQRLKEKKQALRIAALLLCVLIITPLSYRIYEPTRQLCWNIYQKTMTMESTDEEIEADQNTKTVLRQYSVEEIKRTIETNQIIDTTGRIMTETISVNLDAEEEIPYHADRRGYLQSGRKEIFWSAIESLKRDPKRLLIGSSMDELMSISHELIDEQASHFHNMVLQIINLYGIPGLGLAIVFYVLVLIECWRLAFVGKHRISEILLTLPIIVLPGFNMLEVGLFTDMSVWAAWFFFCCGQVVRLRKTDSLCKEIAGK